jgi:ABC-type sugar transport system permease subunit
VTTDVELPGTTGRRRKALPGESRWIAGIFLLPAAVFLLSIVFYPMVYTVIRSLFHDGPSGDPTGFAGLANYIDIFTSPDSWTAFRNNVLWVVIVPVLVTIFGLIFAVLTERVRFSSAFKVVLFMPMAISFLAAGITWSLIYVDEPSQGLGNAIVTGVHDTFSPSTSYPGLHPLDNTVLTGSAKKGFTSKATFAPGQTALLPITGLDLTAPPPAGCCRMNTMSKIFNTLITIVTKTTSSTGDSSGIVTRRNTCHSVAPSMRAASSASRGIAAIPAASSTIANPVKIHMYATMIAGVMRYLPSQEMPPNAGAKSLGGSVRV